MPTQVEKNTVIRHVSIKWLTFARVESIPIRKANSGLLMSFVACDRCRTCPTWSRDRGLTRWPNLFSHSAALNDNGLWFPPTTSAVEFVYDHSAS